MNNVIERKWCTKGTVYIEDLTGTAFTGEDGGHTFVISGVNPDGTAVTLAGTVAGAYILPDGSTQPLTGSIADGKAQITLDPECYALPGRGQLTIFLMASGQKVAIYGAVLNVARSSTAQVPPAITADVADLVQDIEEARASIPASYTNLMIGLAKNYEDLTFPIKAGAYAWHAGKLYEANQDINTAESWNSAHWKIAHAANNLAANVSQLKSAIDSMSTATAEDEGKALKAKTVSNGKVTEWEFGGVGGISNDVKEALLACFEKVAWIDDSGQDYYDALEATLYPPADLASISAVFTQGQAVIYDTDSLETLKQHLVVTAHYDNQTTETVIGYTLSGTLTEGTSTITVAYYGKTTTFSVTVTAYIPSGYTQYDYVKNLYSQTDRDNNIINTGLSSTYCDPEYEHEITFEIDENTISGSAVSAFYGSRPYSGSAGSKVGNSIWMNPTSSPNKIAVGYNGVDSSFTITCSYGDKHTVKLNSGKIYLDDVTVKEQSGERESYDTSSIHLFGAGQGSGISGTATTLVKIYHFKLKDISTGNVISEMVPCTDSNGKPGFYDVIRRSFHTMTDGTKYTCGNDE